MSGGKFFQGDKYQVETGSTDHIALCTCWTDVPSLLESNPSIKDYFGVIGTLFSREGVSVLVRNLCLHPEIQYVLVWAKSPLSQTEMGKAGWTTLLSLWKDGISDDGEVNGHSLHKEIDVGAVRELINSVKVIDVSSLSVEEIVEKVKKGEFPKQDITREPVSFPPPARDTSEALPSEEVGWLVRQPKVVLAWLKVVDKILRYGRVNKTDYGSKQKELQVVDWVVEKEDIADPYIPEWPSEVRNLIGLDKEAIEKYSGYFLNPELPEGVIYTYGERLRNYVGIDQIEKLIERLKGNISSRRAVAVTLNPDKDAESASPPCLNHIQVLAGDAVNLIAVFRSHDIFKAAIPNAFGLLALQKYIAEEVNLPRGKLSIISNSAHIYEEEWKAAEKLLDGKISLDFNTETDMDPRGAVRITVGDVITVDINSYDGRNLSTYSGKTARELIMRIARQELLSRSDHYSDIALELLKAEICLKMGKKYMQDTPLEFDGFSVR